MLPLLIAQFAAAQALFFERLEAARVIFVLRLQVEQLKAAGNNRSLKPIDRAIWIGISKLFKNWRAHLIMVSPKNVIGWHRKGYQRFWAIKCRPVGRPKIPKDLIRLIRTMADDNHGWSAIRIRDELLKLGVRIAASTIGKYIHRRHPKQPGPPRLDQNWQTFIQNHFDAIIACDFTSVPTAFFGNVLVFNIIHLGTRRVWTNATANPSLDWIKNQIRQVVAFGDVEPKFLIHDNDGLFGQFGMKTTDRPFRCALDMWLANTFQIKGIPTPYHSPNANAFVERFNLSLKREALDHYIFLNADHVRRVAQEYVRFYNTARPHQGLNGIPDPDVALRAPPDTNASVIALPVLGGIQHDYRRAA